MADYNQIFVDTDLSLDDFAKEVSILSGTPLEKYSDYDYPDDIAYAFVSNIVRGDVEPNFFGDDDDLQLAQYKYMISARTPRLLGVDPNVADRRRDAFLQDLFVKLKSTNRYALLLVMGLAIVKAQYDPKESELSV